jgi:hypothetical protein
MPGRTRGQLVLFEQDHIRPTQVRKVIRDAASGHSATDDDDACARRQLLAKITHRNTFH